QLQLRPREASPQAGIPRLPPPHGGRGRCTARVVRVGNAGSAATQRRAVREGVEATQHKARARAIKIYLYDDALKCHVVKVIGYRADCECGMKGDRRKQMSYAQADAKWHVADERE